METRGYRGRVLIVGLILACIPSHLWAHGIEGKRMFIEPLFTEDANVKNEVDLPRAEFLTLPDGTFRTFSLSFEKVLYPNRWSVVIGQSRVYHHLYGSTLAGFDDLEIGTKLAMYRNAEHELVLSPALFVTVPTGSRRVAEHRTNLQPTLVFAKGFGDLRWGLLRPLALQGDIGYETTIIGERERHAIYDMVLEYSVPYFDHFIRKADAGFDLEHNLRMGHSSRAILGDMFPFFEFNGSTPIGGTRGSSARFLRPGTAYIGKFFQISAAADVPLHGYLPRRRLGAVVLFDLFLNEVLPAFGWTPFGKHPRQKDEQKHEH